MKTRTLAGLLALASRKQLHVPGQPKGYQKAEKARLEKLSGADAELKDWAQKTLPTLKQHLAKAQELAHGKSANASTDR